MNKDIMSYENNNIVEAFCKNYDVEVTEAQDIFAQLMKWFVFCTDKKTSELRNIDDATLIIDEMWHTFIIFTDEYTRFCNQYIGYYLHHSPSTNADLEQQRKRSIEEIKAKKKAQYELVYDILGKDTFVKWYHEYPKVYSLKNLSKLKKNIFI